MKIDEKYINTSFVGDAEAGWFLKKVFMCSSENEIVDFACDVIDNGIRTGMDINDYHVEFSHGFRNIGGGRISGWSLCNFKVVSCDPFVFMADGIKIYPYRKNEGEQNV